MILMIDNYDSFTYNLVQYLGELGEDLKVFRNDKISVAQIKKLKPEAVVISPGPGIPQDAGISCDVINELKGKVPILGVCLGHQAIGYVFGGKIIRAKNLMHGKTSQIFHTGEYIFKGLPDPFEATRYHSLLIDNKTFPKELELLAWTKQKEIMGLRHKKYPIYGVQFHPESIMTKYGKQLLQNFLKLAL
ncbi:MAG TPA: anthranilate/aminodeoxychorismate synthase component II [Candidatus Omnitrophica bacterium]|nr:anthranilate/aminodeoxychorismate synthase component II [Candidatus Omnitrophota bacterium]